MGTSQVESLVWSAHGNYLAAGCTDGSVHVQRIQEEMPREINKKKNMDGYKPVNIILCVAFSPNGKFIATGSTNATVKIWEVESGNESESIGPLKHSEWVLYVAWSHDSKALVTGTHVFCRCEQRLVHEPEMP
jgi:WD40 repeat protein